MGKKYTFKSYISGLLLSASFFGMTACHEISQTTGLDTIIGDTEPKQFEPDVFADLRILQYKVPNFESLSLAQKKYIYYLSQASLSGRDIIFEQNNKYNILIRKTLEGIIKTYSGDRTGDEWNDFMTYAKRFWFSNGIHHHSSENKIIPECSEAYFASLIRHSDAHHLPIPDDKNIHDFIVMIEPIIFNPELESKRVNKNPSEDIIATSFCNFYREVSQKDVTEFYHHLASQSKDKYFPFGLNSKLVRSNTPPRFAFGNKKDNIYELLWCVGGKYHPSGHPGLYASVIEKVVFWLEKAKGVAENEHQKKYLQHLIDFYRGGDLHKFEAYSKEWVKETQGEVEFVSGFVEVYHDPLGYKGAYESSVYIEDKAASERMKMLAQNADWFEKNAPIPNEYKKQDVKGISYRVVNVIQQAGDAAPYSPIGINLPNLENIRNQLGSKSFSLGNIIDANNTHNNAGLVDEFFFEEETKERIRKYGVLSENLSTAMHEVLGHASGKLKTGSIPPQESLRHYYSTLEEARADLFALYYLLEPKLQELGLTTSEEIAKAEYDMYITYGMLIQLHKIQSNQSIEDDHMRSRQLIAQWAVNNGLKNGIIEKKEVSDKTYYIIKDYKGLQKIFGQLLFDVQKIISEGNYGAAQKLVETYGVKTDTKLIEQVKTRYATLNMPAFTGFIQPKLVPVMKGEEITDIKIEYPTNFVEQMLEYGEKYSFLPITYSIHHVK